MTFNIRDPLVVFGAVATAGIVSLVFAAWLATREVVFALDGVRTTGVVAAKDAEAGGSSGATLKVRYRFTAPDGRSIDGDDIIGSDQWARLAIGGPITLDVARSFPAAFNRVSDNAPLLVLAIVLLAGAVFTRVALPRFVERLRYLVLRRRLQTAGVQVQGTVVEVVSANVRVSGRTLARVRYRYADEHGGEHAGQSESVAPDVAEAWQGCGKGSVIYDPERPDASVWLGDCND